MFAYWKHCKVYYRETTLPSLQIALRRFRACFTGTSAERIGPRSIKIYRQLLIDQGLARPTINKAVGWIKAMYQWAAEEELVEAGAWQLIPAVRGLRRDRSAARETEPVRPVSNAGRDEEYLELMVSLIEGWRRAWSDASAEQTEFPFYFVQLPNYRDRSEQPRDTSWAALREAQRKTLSRVPATGMAITVDIGDPADIHPTNKLPVAERLVRLALHDYYTQSERVPSGPLAIDARHNGDGAARVRFAHGIELSTTDGQSPAGFALAGEDGVFHWAEASITSEGSVVLRSDQVSQPATVRYAWDDNPGVNLVNGEGLPASPFELPVLGRLSSGVRSEGDSR